MEYNKEPIWECPICHTLAYTESFKKNHIKEEVKEISESLKILKDLL